MRRGYWRGLLLSAIVAAAFAVARGWFCFFLLFFVAVGVCGLAFIVWYWIGMHEYLRRRMRWSLARLDELFET